LLLSLKALPPLEQLRLLRLEPSEGVVFGFRPRLM